MSSTQACCGGQITEMIKKQKRTEKSAYIVAKYAAFLSLMLIMSYIESQ